jgi:hypothetical protein
MYLGLLKYMMEWIGGFLKSHGKAAVFDMIWKNLSSYPGFSPPKKAFWEVVQWQGKELRNFGRTILGALAAALSLPTDRERPVFSKALACVRFLTDFQLLAQYRSHSNATLQYMNDYLLQFHKLKDIFSKYRISKKAAQGIAVALKDLRQDHKEILDATEERSTAKRRKINEENRVQLETLKETKELEDARFDFIKMHLPTHYEDHVRRLGAIPPYSTEVDESTHRRQIKDSYRASSHQIFHQQVIQYYTRISAMGICQLNVKQ